MRSRLVPVALAVVACAAAAACSPAPTSTPSPSASAPAAVATQTTAAPATAAPATALPSPTPTPVPSPTATPSPTPAATPTPTPAPVPAPLTGLPVPSAVAARPVVAVMIDDHADARPQSGLAAADIVWQAPAEGGIPRFMALFSSKAPKLIGPVRSARLYFVAWAAEQGAVYVHAGGSPGALGELARSGNGATVWNIEGLANVGGPFWRTTDKWAPHNLYTSSQAVAGVAKGFGYAPAPGRPAFAFAPPAGRPAHGPGFRLAFSYGATEVEYTFDPAMRAYPRSENGVPTTDAAAKARIAPTNVVVLSMPFAPAADGSGHGRLDAGLVGEGDAMVFRAGKLVKARWRKAAFDAPTELLAPGVDGSLAPIALVPGQTFVQVVPTGTPVAVTDAGGAAVPASTRPAPGVGS